MLREIFKEKNYVCSELPKIAMLPKNSVWSLEFNSSIKPHSKVQSFFNLE